MTTQTGNGPLTRPATGSTPQHQAAESPRSEAEDAAVLERRARALARPVGRSDEWGDGPANGVGIEVAVFRLAGERYALETRYVRRVVRLPTPTPVPGTPAYLVGLVNLHGEILAVFDFRPLLGLTTALATDRTRVLVLGTAGDEFGVLVDAAEEVVRLRPEGIFPYHSGGEGMARGVTRDALSVLDGAALLRDPRLTIHSGDGPGTEAGPAGGEAGGLP